MPVTITYDSDSRLTVSGIACGCPCEHRLPTQDIYVGTGLVARLPEYIRRRGLGTRCVLAADNITWEVAGQGVRNALAADGFDVTCCVIRRDGPMDPDETACGEVLLSIRPDTQFLISVGSGSITDTVRVNAVRTGLPFISVGTAPSMDGYTSVIAPLLLRGVKIHRAGVCPEIILCDTDILRTAPQDMICSGVGDVLGKYIARCDWMIGNIINDEPYCPVCGEIVTDAVKKLLDHVDDIRLRTGKGMRVLIEALLLSGLTVMIVGHTRAVASAEHNIAHYWEMMQLFHGNKPPAHGASVGVATLLLWPLFTRFAVEDLSLLNLAQIQKNRLSRKDRVSWMLHAFEDTAGNAIMEENQGDFLTWAEQERRVLRAQRRIGEIRQAIAGLPPFEAVQSAMGRLGARLTPEELGVDSRLLALSMRCAKDYRTRYTLLKLIDECGLQEKYMDGYPSSWQPADE
jgi:glycerol-1-phosphate dehydrogenase [NAD(P)+]